MNKEFNKANVRELLKKYKTGKASWSIENIPEYEFSKWKDYPLLWKKAILVSAISKLQCPKCKNIRYLDKTELEETIDGYFNCHWRNDETKEYTMTDQGNIIDLILELAIPDDKKIKELEEQCATMEESYIKANEKLEAKIEKLEDRNRKLGSKVLVAKCLYDDLAEGLDKMSGKLNKL